MKRIACLFLACCTLASAAPGGGWLIEIAFRAWKQSSNMAKALNRVSSPRHLKGLVLAGMIAMAIGLKTGLSLARSKPNLKYSLEKIFDYTIARLVAL